ncbi:YafY family transcriptional regulator [Gilvimarinus agarilyticus]|uniref:helix-turn-helix transcriptional regulator n=1 Tax=unclassified Gilvimarinus TaxID=2642066 RepID=UPI001C0918F6|nr:MULTISPECIES: YafY family protein [unclassified Gilvimarinus]MBU2887541.1 YafY family transcriptional regulator [Gilvimarinus agarilyticus]MDO6572192.1 YafY family protein [Gilvimarinus sp. 2_MG-2023]MDO6746756.1 YafY family protein [Gilvimarinus sp. 1_MG-2023]
MATTATRLIHMIMALQREPNLSASKLADELEVSVRTVQRYIGMLEEMGVPIYAERGSHGGYSLVRGYRMPPLMFSAQEAVAVCLGAEMVARAWGKLFRPAAQSAMTKIANVLPEAQLADMNWARESLLTRGMPRINPTIDEGRLHQVYQAVHERTQLTIEYRSRGQIHSISRTIDPYALVYSWGQQYCLAFCHLRGALRSFRVDRIETVEALNVTFERPVNFDPDDYFSPSALESEAFEVVLFFPKNQALVAKDHPCCWDNLVNHPDGSVTASFKSAELDMAACRVMGFLPGAELQSPPALIALVRDKARAIAESYQSATALPTPA